MFANHNRCYEKSSSGVLPGNDAFKLRVTSLMGIVIVFHQLFYVRNFVAEERGPVV
jgi:hypothetical protein